jgi:hypothetical protein
MPPSRPYIDNAAPGPRRDGFFKSRNSGKKYLLFSLKFRKILPKRRPVPRQLEGKTHKKYPTPLSQDFPYGTVTGKTAV